MQHINIQQIEKINRIIGKLNAGLKSGDLKINDPEAIRMQNQIDNFLSCARKGARKFLNTWKR